MRFYRLAHTDNQQGLWYDRNGSFAGRIRNEYIDFKNSKLPMGFDPEIIGYLSVTNTIETLFDWFSWDDIKKAYADGYRIMVYDAEPKDFKYYSLCSHWLIKQEIPPTFIHDGMTIKSLCVEHGAMCGGWCDGSAVEPSDFMCFLSIYEQLDAAAIEQTKQAVYAKFGMPMGGCEQWER